MRLIITIDYRGAALEDAPTEELRRLLSTVPAKVEAQLARAPGCVCTTPESVDKLLDSNGNTVGTVVLTRG